MSLNLNLYETQKKIAQNTKNTYLLFTGLIMHADYWFIFLHLFFTSAYKSRSNLMLNGSYLAVNVNGDLGGITPRSHNSFTDDKAPGNLIPQMQALIFGIKINC